MRALLIGIFMMVVFGCQSRHPAPWEQTGKAGDETQADYADCAKEALQHSAARSADNSPEFALAGCMERKGYHRNKGDRFVCCRRLLGS